MIRLKLTLIYLSVTIIGVVVTLALLSGAKTNADEALVAEVTRSHLIYEQVKRLRDLQLRDVAQAVAQSEIGSYLAVLKVHRRTMHRIQGEVFKRVPGDDKAGRLKVLESDYDDVHKTMATDLAQRLAVSGHAPFSNPEARAAFVKETMGRLADCQSQSVKQCTYELTRNALVEVAERLRSRPVYGIKPSVLIVADDRNVGLADADRKFYAADSAFAENFAVARQVKKGIIARDIAVVDTPSHKGTFFLTAAPVFDDEHRFLGTVLAGAELDTGLLKSEKKILGRDVTYFDGKKPIRSTLDQRSLERLVIVAKPVDAANPQLHTLQTETTIAQFVPLTGNWSQNNISVAISAGRDSARALDGVTIWIPLVFGLLFVFGTALFMWAVHHFLKPAFEIDSGIHEVISGDRDYMFPDDYSVELWEGMAQSLNQMVGELVGREMVDEEGFDDWARSYLQSAHAEQDAAAQDADEPEDVYYQRIYGRFKSLGEAAGKEPLSYAKFVEKVSRTETALSKRLGLKGVRLEVVDGANGPVLKPVKKPAPTKG